MNKSTKQYIGKAFISCSLREEDKKFIDLIMRIIDHFNLQPFGTVGKFSAAPVTPAELMKVEIPKADVLVIVATPRYIQQDIRTRDKRNTISEMLHVETGMAYALNKPVLVFVQKGTDVGNFLPTITQYIELDGSREDLKLKRDIIVDYMNNCKNKFIEAKKKKKSKAFWEIVGGGMAIYGGIKLLEDLGFVDYEEDDDEDD